MTNDQLLALTNILQPQQPVGPVFDTTLNATAYHQLIWLYPPGQVISGNIAQTLPAITQQANGDIAGVISGDIAQTLPAIVQAADGREPDMWKDPGCRAVSVPERVAVTVDGECRE